MHGYCVFNTIFCHSFSWWINKDDINFIIFMIMRKICGILTNIVAMIKVIHFSIVVGIINGFFNDFNTNHAFCMFTDSHTDGTCACIHINACFVSRKISGFNGLIVQNFHLYRVDLEEGFKVQFHFVTQTFFNDVVISI